MNLNLSNRVTIVDDDLLFLSAIKRNLERRGIEVFDFSDSLLAIKEILEKDLTDLLILDLTMPDFDGVEFMETLAMANYRAPIFLVSGWWSETLQLCTVLGRANGLNIVGAYEKPFDIAHVYQYLQL